MPKLKLLAAGAAALVAAGCASDPVYYSEPRYSSPNAYYANGAAYSDVGRVVAIDVVREREGGIGAGAVIGGIVGGVLGHQVGSGRGNDLATAAGAVGGAVAGHQIEKNRRDDVYRITVQLRDGREAVFTRDSLDGIRVGDRVRVDGNRLYRD